MTETIHAGHEPEVLEPGVDEPDVRPSPMNSATGQNEEGEHLEGVAEFGRLGDQGERDAAAETAVRRISRGRSRVYVFLVASSFSARSRGSAAVRRRARRSGGDLPFLHAVWSRDARVGPRSCWCRAGRRRRLRSMATKPGKRHMSPVQRSRRWSLRRAAPEEGLRAGAVPAAGASWSRCRSGCGPRARGSWSSSRAATPPARAARSSGSRSTSTPASPASSRCPRRPSASAAQWYFQRYVAQLPAAGEIVLLRPLLVQPRRRRAGDGLLHPGRVPPLPAPVPDLRADARRGRHPAAQVLVLGQRRRAGGRFQSRLDDPMRRWKLSPMDLESITRWEDYSQAKDQMLVHTDIPEAPLVRGRERRQAARAAEHDRPPAVARSTTTT